MWAATLRFRGVSELETRELALKLERAGKALLGPRYAIPFLVVVASVLRLIPMRFKYLLGYDPYFHLAYIRYALSHGWVNFFPYAFGPWGFQVRQFHPLGLWMTPAIVYKLLRPFGISLYNSFRITPVVFGVLTVLLVYLVVLRLYGKLEAFFSALFLGVSFGHVFRSMAGYYRGDNYMLFWYSVALFGVALALSMGKSRKGYGRLALYLIPSLAAGFSAVFWRAYYPIFVFLVSSAVFMAVGAFLLDRREGFLDSIALILSTVLGALVANAMGPHFGFGMLGAGTSLGEKFAGEFGLHFGVIKDAFLLLYLQYVVPAVLLAVLVLFGLSRVLDSLRVKLVLFGAGAVVVSLLLFWYYGRVADLMGGIFPTWDILETQRTSLRDIWTAYGVEFLLIPAFLLRFSPRRVGMRDFVLIGPVIVSLIMIFTWARFLFIGSMAVAVMAGVGIGELHVVLSPLMDAKKLGTLFTVLLFLSFPLVAGFQGFHGVYGVSPLVDGHWESALVSLGEESSINDVVLTWWDQGNWVTYYSMRAPVAQLWPNKFVASYYLGLKSEESLMKMGVDYVIVSYDTVMKFGTILETADASPLEYALVPMPLVSSGGGMLVFALGSYSIIVVPGNEWDVKVNAGGRTLVPRKVFVERGNEVERVPTAGKPNSDAYVYVNLNYGYAVLMNGKTFNTPLARLMFTDEYSENYRLVYSDGGIVKVFRFIHPNVAVTAENGSVVLRFENATGRGLELYGYLDNGTLVFRKWYRVKGLNEFALPSNLNGSVVIRYAYSRAGTVLDSGVFRVSDVTEKGGR